VSTIEPGTRSPAARATNPDDRVRAVGVAQEVAGILKSAIGGPLPLRLRGWDGSDAGDPSSPATLVLRNPTGPRRLIWAPNELGPPPRQVEELSVSVHITCDGSVGQILGPQSTSYTQNQLVPA